MSDQPSKYDPRLYSMSSTGNPEADQQEIERFIRESMLIDEGLCPNNCSVALVEVDAYTQECPSCHFVLFRRMFHAGETN